MKSLGRELLTESIKENISSSRIMKEYVNVANQGQRLFVGSGTGLSEAEEAEIREMAASLYEDREEEFYDLGKDFDPKRVDESLGSDTDAPMKEDSQGWSNKPTWLAALWINNDQWMYDEARDMARNAKDSHELAQQLESWLEELFEDQIPKDGFIADLFNWSWAHIEWNEVADHCMAEVGEEDETPEE